MVGLSIGAELSKAKQEYILAIQQEENAEGEFIDVAIMNTNAATIRLESVVKRAKLMGYESDKIIAYA